MANHGRKGRKDQGAHDKASASHRHYSDRLDIRIPLQHALSDAELEAIATIEGRFGTEDLMFSVELDAVHCFLKSIRFEELDTFVRELPGAPEDGNWIPGEIVSRIAAIRSYGIRGGKRIYAGYDRERKVRNRLEKAAGRTPAFYARDSGFSSEENNLPAKFENAIICGDSATVLAQLPDNCVDIIFTSPPYNFGLDYDEGEDDLHWEAYFKKLFSIFSECIRVLKYGGRIIVNVQPLFSDYIPLHHMISGFFTDKGLIWKGEILWEKHNYNCKYTAWGSWKSPSSPYLKYTWEFVEIFCKGDIKKSGEKEMIDITAEEFKDWVYAKWAVAPERNMRGFDHPAMFPEELVERVLKLFSYRGDLVLDPFNGVGTTTAVAQRLGRRYLGVDISEQYCATALQRLSDE